MAGVGHQALHLLANRSQLFHRQVGQGLLEVGEFLAAKFAQNSLGADIRQGGINGDQVGRFGPALEAIYGFRQGQWIGLGLADFLCDFIRAVGHGEAGIARGIGLRHFLAAVAQAHHPGRFAEDQWFHDGENSLPEIVVEFLRHVPGQFQVLFLILAYGHMGSLVQQNIGGHQHGINIQPGGGVFAILARFLLELGHPVQPAQARYAVEDPGQFSMGRNLALIEDDMLAGVDAGGQKGRRHFTGIGL